MRIVALAKTKYIRMAPRKVKKVIDLVRGKSYRQALYILEYTTKIASGPVWQTLYSAAANAKNLENINKDDLYIYEIYVNAGAIMKRIRPRQKGRAFKIQKKISHITIKLAIKN